MDVMICSVQWCTNGLFLLYKLLACYSTLLFISMRRVVVILVQRPIYRIPIRFTKDTAGINNKQSSLQIPTGQPNSSCHDPVVVQVPNKPAELPERLTFSHVKDGVPYLEGGLLKSSGSQGGCHQKWQQRERKRKEETKRKGKGRKERQKEGRKKRTRGEAVHVHVGASSSR